MMRRGLLLFVGVSLLSVLTGCHRSCVGRCDCLVYPLSHGTPSPIVQPAQPIAPVSAH